MTDSELEKLFRDWWPYPAPPGNHALMTHLGWARHVLTTVEYETNLRLRQEKTAKAHLLGAQDDPESRRKYFRELAEIDNLSGITDSPFERLG